MLRLCLAVAALMALSLVLAGAGSAKNRPKPPDASAVSQYVEMMPGAGGAKPSSGRTAPHKTAKQAGMKKVASVGAPDPVSAAFGTTGGGLGGGALLAIILGAIAAAGAVVYAVRRRLSREQSG
jgi:hypothetical protein